MFADDLKICIPLVSPFDEKVMQEDGDCLVSWSKLNSCFFNMANHSYEAKRVILHTMNNLPLTKLAIVTCKYHN